MTVRLKTFSWFIFAVAGVVLVPTSIASAQDVDIPNFAPDEGKPNPPAMLPIPSDSNPLPAPNRISSPANPRPKPTDPRPLQPKSIPQPDAAPEPSRPSELDAETVPAAAEPDGEKNPLELAKTKPGAPAGPGHPEPNQAESLVLKPEQLPAGRQTVGMAVEVVAPEVMNIHHSGTIKIIVKNTGVVDARAVRIRYDLPSELELVSAQPEQKQIPGEPSLLSWGPETVAAGSEWLILLKVKATKVNTIDHAALVTLAVGSRAHTVIQEPMLKVEQTVTPSKLLKGQQARFSIFVTNPGSGPARNVVVRATLSSGLKADGEDIVEQTIPIIQAGGRMELDPLVVDTMAGGEQTCTVLATSPDVTGGPDAKVVRSVVVLRPELNLAITGPAVGYTDTFANYKVVASNPGTAVAKDVRVAIALPPNTGKLQKPLPAGTEWNQSKSTLTWTIPKIDSKTGEKPGTATIAFRVRLGSPGMYRVVADARAGDLHANDAAPTNVSGLAEVELNVTERRRVLDVEETTIFDITMKNVGSKTAKNLQVRAKLSKNLRAEDTAGLDDGQNVRPDSEKPDELIFPLIPSLAVGRELNISLRVLATQAGSATCRVFVMHDDIPDKDSQVEAIAQARVTGVSEKKLK